MKISVIICTRDREETIGQALESVAQCEYDRFDIHVMDQSTRPATRECVEALAARFKGTVPIHYHHLDKAGLSRASNAGTRVSDGEVIAFTDDDVIVPPDWLSAIAAAFTKDPQAGLLYGQVLVPASLQPLVDAGTIVPSLVWDKPERLIKGGAFKVFGMGANMAITRRMLQEVRGFDEALGGGGPLRSSQDFDFAYRTYLAGYAILLEPSVKVDHYGTRTADQWPATMVNYGIGDGAFYAKHIRCGDMRALRILTWRYVYLRMREVKKLLTTGRYQRDDYGSNLLVGVRAAMPFAVDKRYRLYQETSRAKMVVTQSNIVTATTRE
ncbi:MAG: glycosyltransferase family A protein [Gemmatimonadaceae bacterium]|nr:glycosyltransferase family A protein [Gemmatimonadaceae bacterium]